MFEEILDDFEVAVGGWVVEETGLGAETFGVDVDGGGEDYGRGTGVGCAEVGYEGAEGGEVGGAGEVDQVVEFGGGGRGERSGGHVGGVEWDDSVR